MARWSTFLFLLLSLAGQAQRIAFEYDTRPTIELAGRTLPNAWAGGLNACQFATLPLDADARPDLVVFDRVTSRISTFLATTGPNNALFWQHAPQYERLFPTIGNWFYLVDYDGDGRKDLFASAPSGIQVWRNATPANGTLTWQLVTPSLQTDALSGIRSNVYVAGPDTPAITDLDGDGDVDVVAFDPTGNQAVYYQNLSKQRTNAAAPAGLDFRTEPGCWGRFKKEFCNDFTANADCAATGGRQGDPNGRPNHTGNTIRLQDVDGDGDGKPELIFGYVDCNNLSVLHNTGPSNQNAAFTRFEYDFPKQNPVRFASFPAAFFEDLDGDGLTDMVASPNVYVNERGLFDFRTTNHFYRNAGTATAPDFQLARTDFLQSDMLDLGENAAPVLADLDGDGDLDLLVGNGGVPLANGFRASLWQFENKGTTSNPAFSLVTTDYLGLTTTDSLTYLRPTFADLDGNGSLDLVLSGFSKTGSVLRWLPNSAAKGAAMRFTPATARSLTLSDGYSAASPLLFTDFDADGKADLLVSGSAGNISYYRNSGSVSEPAFTLVTDRFAGFDFAFDNRNASLALTDVNGDNQKRLMLATRTGQLRVYKLASQPTQAATLLDTLGTLPTAGLNPILATGDLSGDGLPDLVLGSLAGGLRYVRNTSDKVSAVLAVEPVSPWAFPNPTNRYVTIRAPHEGQVEVISIDGRTVLTPIRVGAHIDQPLDLGTLSSGVYLLRLSAADQPTKVSRVVLGR